MNRHDINIIGLKRMPTIDDIRAVGLVSLDYTSTSDAWTFCAETLPAPGTKAEWVPAGEIQEGFDCVIWWDEGGLWYMPADIFIWNAA